MAKHRTRVGIHARNDVRWPEADFALVRHAGIETIKMMSFTDNSVFERLKRENSSIEFIVRLYDDRLRNNSRPSPAAFVAKMVPIINRQRPYVAKFEIHNEPNHVDGIEAWGSSDQHARSFRSWYLQTLPALKQACPWASFGFPGLALNHPHRDLEWLDICRDAILASDWLGCHCYWQYGNMMKDEWGLRFKLYHERFPNMTIEITEFGDSTPNRPREEIAKQYVQYYAELNKYAYLGSASAFIASSPDPAWVTFVWMKEGGEMLPVAHYVRNMKREAVDVTPVPSPGPGPTGEPGGAPTPEPIEDLAERTFRETGKTVRGSFLRFFNQYGLDVCGYPISDEIVEAGRPSQYFQRVGLEETSPGKIRLKLVGIEAWKSRTTIAELQARIEELRSQPASGGGGAQPAIEDIVDQLTTHATQRYPNRKLTEITQIVIHHTATSPTITPQRLADYQVRKLDKAGIAYHFVVAADGTIYQTNRLETVSDHAFGRNQDSVGICFPGNFGSAIPTTAQIESGGQLCAWLLGRLRLPTNRIVGLGEFVNTQSPGRQWLRGQRWKDKLLAEVEASMQTGGEDQGLLIATLREQIATLEAEIAALEARPPSPGGVPSTASVQHVVDEIEAVTSSLQTQIKVLQSENKKLMAELEATPEGPSEEQLAEIATLNRKITTLERERDNALSDLAAVQTALQAKDAEQSALITSLRNQIKSLQNQIAQLQNQITQLKERPTPVIVTDPTPISGDGKVRQPIVQNMINKLAKHGTKRYNTRPLSDIKTFVIHHSAVPASVGPQRIATYHVNSLDWPGAGYHFMVAEDGVIYQANALKTVSYHAAKVNPRGVGICFLGSFQKTVPPPAQLQAGAHLVAWLLGELNIELDMVKGHQEYMQTACPGNQWLRGKKWKQMLRQEVIKIQEQEPQPVIVPGAKSIYHYMLFWHRGDSWAATDFGNAQDYIGAFQPTVGFSAQEAAQAENVTIVGGPLGVPKKVEDWLISQGSRVDRIAGANEGATKAMLTNLIKKDKRFRSFDE